MRTALVLLSFVACNLVACSGGGIIGAKDRDAAPPSPDAGGCDKGLVPCGGECLVTCAAPDGGAPPGTDAAPGDASSTDAPSAPDAVAPPPDASEAAAPTQYNLYVTMTGFFAENGQEYHEYAEDTTTGDSWASCGGGGAIEGGGMAEHLDTNTLVAGHTYAYEYWFDTSSFTFCSSGPTSPTYYVHAFGPITADTYITITPADPIHE